MGRHKHTIFSLLPLPFFFVDVSFINDYIHQADDSFAL